MDKYYFVYKHTSPEGKVYIGITSQHSPESRWGPGGSGYKGNVAFWYDIQRLGWDNFKHEILASGLKEHEALHMESELIHLYRATKPENGYNLDAGHLYPEEDASILKLKRHFNGKNAIIQNSKTAEMRQAMKFAMRAMKKKK